MDTAKFTQHNWADNLFGLSNKIYSYILISIFRIPELIFEIKKIFRVKSHVRDIFPQVYVHVKK